MLESIRELVEAVNEDILPENIFAQMRLARSNGPQPEQFRDELEAMRCILSVFNRNKVRERITLWPEHLIG